MSGGKKTRGRAGYGEAKRKIYHVIFRQILQGLQDCHVNGGFMATRVSQPRACGLFYHIFCRNYFYVSHPSLTEVSRSFSGPAWPSWSTTTQKGSVWLAFTIQWKQSIPVGCAGACCSVIFYGNFFMGFHCQGKRCRSRLARSRRKRSGQIRHERSRGNPPAAAGSSHQHKICKKIIS